MLIQHILGEVLIPCNKTQAILTHCEFFLNFAGWAYNYMKRRKLLRYFQLRNITKRTFDLNTR